MFCFCFEILTRLALIRLSYKSSWHTGQSLSFPPGGLPLWNEKISTESSSYHFHHYSLLENSGEVQYSFFTDLITNKVTFFRNLGYSLVQTILDKIFVKNWFLHSFRILENPPPSINVVLSKNELHSTLILGKGAKKHIFQTFDIIFCLRLSERGFSWKTLKKQNFLTKLVN